MTLDIISPEKIIYVGKADSVTLPGLVGSFTILDRHAPIISGLGEGTLTYSHEGKEISLAVKGGFVEANKNIVTICVE